MNKKNNILFNKLKRKITLQLIKRTIIETIVLITAFTVLLLLGKIICSFKVWNGREPLYLWLNIIANNAPAVILLLCFIIVIIALIHSCVQTFGYLSDMMEAVENIYEDNADLIELPVILKEIENKLNHIKINVRENERMAKEEEKKKNDLVVYLAHDLKTPLTSVIGYLTLLKDEDQISKELREKYLSITLDKAERLEELINEFFEITRFNLTQISLELSNVNLNRMLEQITYEFKPMLQEKNLTCSLNLEPGLMLYCDVDKTERVFDNLLRNAVNYCYEGTSIDITAKKKNDYVVIECCNCGNTIPPEKLNHLFEQFFRVDSARTSKSGGAGLGLAIAKQIVELHGGRISAESTDERIVFCVEMPLSGSVNNQFVRKL